jgi:predicted nucleic acid-binding protein
VSPPDRGPVVVDTSVYSARFGPRRGDRLASEYKAVLEGWTAVISYVTVAEMRFGARIAGWGTRRLQRLDHDLGQAKIVWPNDDLVATRTMRPIAGLPPQRSVLESRLSRMTQSFPVPKTSN